LQLGELGVLRHDPLLHRPVEAPPGEPEEHRRHGDADAEPDVPGSVLQRRDRHSGLPPIRRPAHQVPAGGAAAAAGASPAAGCSAGGSATEKLKVMTKLYTGPCLLVSRRRGSWNSGTLPRFSMKAAIWLVLKALPRSSMLFDLSVIWSSQ